LLLPLILLGLSQLYFVQNFLKDTAVNYLKKKLHTEVSIGSFSLHKFSQISLEDVLLADRQADTLFFSRKLVVNCDLLALLGNKLVIHDLQWEGVKAHVYRSPSDTSFNYQFIIDAFSAGEPSSDTSESSSGMRFVIDTVQLKAFDLRYEDYPGGVWGAVRFDSIGLRAGALNPDSMKYVLHDLFLDGIAGDIRMRPSRLQEPPTGTQEDSGPLPSLAIGRIKVQQSHFLFSDTASGFFTLDTVGGLEVSRLAMNLPQQQISVDSLLLENTYSGVGFMAATGAEEEEPEDTTSGSYQITARQLLLRRTRFALNNQEAVPISYRHAMDYNHLFVDSIEADIGDVAYLGDTLTATVNHIAMAEQSGFRIKQFKAKVRYDPGTVDLDNLELLTNGSYLGDTIHVSAPSWSAVADHLDDLRLQCDLRQCRLDASEVLFFMPEWANDPSIKPLLRKKIDLDAHLSGRLADLKISRLALSDQDGNVLHLRGSVRHGGDPEALEADIDLQTLQTGNAPLRSWLASGMLPEEYQLPGRIVLSGPISASRKKVHTDLNLQSSEGNVYLRADLNQFMDSIQARYNIVFRTEGIPLGKWIGDTVLGRVVARGQLQGKGWSPQYMEDTVDVEIPALEYNHYLYQGTALSGRVSGGSYRLNARSQDTAATFQIAFHGSLDTPRTIVGFAQVDKLDLYATHWYPEPLSLHAALQAQMDNLQPYHLRGSLSIDSVAVVQAGGTVSLDTVRLLASDSSGGQFISLEGPFGSVTATGHFDYTSVYQPISALMLYHLGPPDSLVHADSLGASQDIELVGNLVWPASLQPLLPELVMDEPLAFQLRANTDSFSLAADLNMPSLQYGDFHLDTTRLNLTADKDSLRANLVLYRLEHPTFPLNETDLTLHAAQGKIAAGFTIHDPEGADQYQLGLYASQPRKGNYMIRFGPQLILNRQPWSASPDNHLTLDSSGLQQINLALQHGSQELSVFSDSSNTGWDSLHVNLKQFRLSSLTSLLANDTALADGLANGSVEVQRRDDAPEFQASLQVDSLKLMNSPLGNLALKAENPTADEYAVDLALTGDSNAVHLQGTYHTTGNNPLDFRLHMAPLSLSSLTPVLAGYLTELTGGLQGDLSINGSLERPRILGTVAFKDAGFHVPAVSGDFHLHDEPITFAENGIQFDNFSLADSSGNQAVLNGHIATRDYTHFRFNLDLTADDFEVLGYPQSRDQLLYGPAYIDSKISIRGTPDLPRVNMNLKLLDRSQVTFAIPEDNPGMSDREGVIRFVDKDNPVQGSLQSTDTLRRRTGLSGVEFSGNLEVTPRATIKIIVDQQNGDNLVVKGNANLNTTMDPGGNFLLTGEYRITEGRYEMSLNQLIKRSFTIQKGSTITWEGEPTRANVDITALYQVDAPAIDLVSDQLSNATPEMRNRFKQKLPIQVYLMIQGEMLEPKISFRLDMPEDYQNALSGTVYTRLKQINLIPSELNKQVMGLLVLNSFIPDNPTDILNNGGTGLAQTARQSVSKILSQQLNNLAANLIKGVDLNFDLQSEEDYSSGTAQNATTLNVGVSKHLFSDRLTVTVGNDFALEGDPQRASGIAGNVSIEYALSKDGRYRLRAYRKNENEEIIQGQIVETGVTFSLVMDYNQFRELFQKAKEEEELPQKKKKKK
jgi:hypothetical protein